MHRTLAPTLALLLIAAPAVGADLQPHTSAAFDRYVRAIEAQMPRRSSFLWIDRPGGDAARRARAALAGGETLIESIDADDTRISRDIRDGLLHHWIGTVFIPGATLESTLALLQDYDRHAAIYAPSVSRSRLMSRDGNTFHLRLRFTMTRVITAVVTTDSEAIFTREGPDRASSRIHSTRVSEVEHAGTAMERELPPGHDSGYLWRLNTYWRLLQQDDGVYVECESISLSRDIPFGLGWIVKPFVTSLPRESLTFTLETTRRALLKK